MDSVMLGSLHAYQRWIKQLTRREELSLFGHGCAGSMAGFTVSFVASPIEHVKVSIAPTMLSQNRLQIQYSSKDRVYTGPLDAYKKIVYQVGKRGLTDSTSPMASAGSTRVSFPQSYSAPCSSYGGPLTNSTPVCSSHTPHSPSPA